VVPADHDDRIHNYVKTSHAAQSKTVDDVLIAENSASFPAASREQLYVSVGRGSRAMRVFLESREELFQAVQASSQRLAAMEMSVHTQGRSRTPVLTLGGKPPTHGGKCTRGEASDWTVA